MLSENLKPCGQDLMKLEGNVSKMTIVSPTCFALGNSPADHFFFFYFTFDMLKPVYEVSATEFYTLLL